MMEVDRESEYLEKLGQGIISLSDALFMQYHPRVKNFLKGFIKDEEEACDMAQDIFSRSGQTGKAFLRSVP